MRSYAFLSFLGFFCLFFVLFYLGKLFCTDFSYYSVRLEIQFLSTVALCPFYHLGLVSLSASSCQKSKEKKRKKTTSSLCQFSMLFHIYVTKRHQIQRSSLRFHNALPRFCFLALPTGAHSHPLQILSIHYFLVISFKWEPIKCHPLNKKCLVAHSQ